MKKVLISIVCSWIISITLNAQSVSIGELIPEFEIALLNGESFSQKDLKGKITILDMWATWCSPCIGSMKKLATLQKHFKDDLQVVAVSYEDQNRIEKFNSKMKFPFAYGLGTEAISNYFPHRVIPHTILIDKKGRVLAITSPENINKEVIEKVLANEKISLPLKYDNIEFSYTEDYFKMDTLTQESFRIQSAIPGIGSFSVQPNSGPFEGRRISLLNFPIDGIYRIAYQTSAYRMKYETDEEQFSYDNPKNKYALDLIVKDSEKEKLHEILQKKVAESFDIKARLEKQKIEVVVLSTLEKGKVQLENSTENISKGAGGDHFTKDGATLTEFANYLESFGIVGKPVVDETNLKDLYNINFSFFPESPETFHTAIKKMGLKLKKEEREIEILIIY